MDIFDLDPRNPIYDLAYDPKGGSGILKAQIWIDNLLWNGRGYEPIHTDTEKLLAYSWVETVNGIALEIERPTIYGANAIEEDIMNSLRKENIKFDTIKLGNALT